MSIKFNVHERVNPRDLTAPKKFYPFIKNDGELTLERMAARISAMCTVNEADVVAVLYAMKQLMVDELGQGRIIRMGTFGSYGLTIQGSGADKKEEVTASHVNRIVIHFKPGPDLYNMLRTVKVEKVPDKKIPPADK